MEFRHRLLLVSLLPLFFASHHAASQGHPVSFPHAADTVASNPTTSILNASSFYTGANGHPAFDASCAVIGPRIAGVSGPTSQVAFRDDTANVALASSSLNAPSFGMAPTSLVSLGQVNAYPGAIASGDFNNDGVPDVAIRASGTSLSILLNNGKGSFETSLSVPATYATEIITADLNGDGNLDLIGTSGSGSAISILLGKGDGSFQEETTLSVDPNAHFDFITGLAAGDFNGDGKQDLAVGIGNTQYTGTLAILFGKGDGAFQAPVINQIPGYPPKGTVPFPSRLLAGFLNNDTKEDLLLLDNENGGAVLLLSNGNGTFQTSALASDSVAVIGDFNTDGFPDIATIDDTSLTVFLNDGNAQFAATTYPSSSGAYLAVGDFNGDGKVDLINSVGSYYGQLYLGNGDGTFQSPSQFPTNFSFASQLVAADFHHNGFYDLATLSEEIPFGDEVQLLINARSATAYANGLSVTAGSWTSHTITCHYSGDANYTASISSNDLLFNFEQALAPTFSLAPGTYPTSQTVTIQDAISQAIINYTTDGSTPTLSSPIYAGPITVTQTETIKAIASRFDYAASPTSEAVYTIAPTPASFSFSPTKLTFATTYLNQPSTFQTLTITNTGTATATVSSYTFTGANANAFYLSGKTCVTSLAGGASCTLTIAFKPTVNGAASANLVAADTATGSPQSVPLSGTGSSQPGISFYPTSLAFPATAIETTSASLVLTVKNPSPFPMTVSSYKFAGTNSSEFTLVSKTCVTSLAANSACTLTITFKPTVVGTASATLVATDNATGSPQSVPLTGSGAALPTMQFSMPSLAFPATAVGRTSIQQTVSVTNTSNSPLGVTSYRFTGTNASEFSLQSKTCGTLLPAQSTCSITIVFKPTVTGPASASLVATDNAINSPQELPLTGTAQ